MAFHKETSNNGEKKNTSKKDQGNGKQSQLEPKLRPVQKIYSSLEIIGKQDPSLMCAQRYAQWMVPYLAHSRNSNSKNATGTPSIVGFCGTSTYSKTTFQEPQIWGHLFWIRLVEKLEARDLAAVSFHLGWLCFLWRKQVREYILQFYFTRLEAAAFLKHFSWIASLLHLFWYVGFFSPCLWFSSF